MTAARLAIAAPGIALGAFGVYRLLTEMTNTVLISLAEWLIAAIVIHDVLLSPSLVGVGWLLSHLPARGRRFVQGGLIAGGLVTVVAVPFIYRQNALPRSYAEEKALLLRDYRVSLAVLLGIVVAGTLVLYAVRVARDAHAVRSGATDEAHPPPADK